MRSVSGVRGIVGTDLTPETVARYAAAFGSIVAQGDGGSVVLGRDSRTSGPTFADAARAGLQSVGIDVIDCGLIPTPTAQLAVEHHRAGGGIVLTASHNPVEWNALKFVGSDGLFLDRASVEALTDSFSIGPPSRRSSRWSTPRNYSTSPGTNSAGVGATPVPSSGISMR
jgi:phosphomannomutase